MTDEAEASAQAESAPKARWLESERQAVADALEDELLAITERIASGKVRDEEGVARLLGRMKEKLESAKQMHLWVSIPWDWDKEVPRIIQEIVPLTAFARGSAEIRNSISRRIYELLNEGLHGKYLQRVQAKLIEATASEEASKQRNEDLVERWSASEDYTSGRIVQVHDIALVSFKHDPKIRLAHVSLIHTRAGTIENISFDIFDLQDRTAFFWTATTTSDVGERTLVFYQRIGAGDKEEWLALTRGFTSLDQRP